MTNLYTLKNETRKLAALWISNLIIAYEKQTTLSLKTTIVISIE